jgi:hypothetical protein
VLNADCTTALFGDNKNWHGAGALAQARGFMTTGRPDESRAARLILKDYMNGVMMYAHPPPGVNLRPDVAASRVPDAQAIAGGAASQGAPSPPASSASLSAMSNK